MNSFFFIFILLILAMTNNGHTQGIIELSEKLKKEKEKEEKPKDLCEIEKKGVTDPDSSPLPKISALAAQEVMLYKGSAMNTFSNYGARAYMTDTLLTDDQFRLQAKDFYEQLSLNDKKVPLISKNNKIDSIATTNYLQLAMKIAKNKPYQALKILALYGHDDVNNSLYGQCLNSEKGPISPGQYSDLYKNGALGIQYPDKLVKEGLEIGKACANPDMPINEKFFCNDGHKYFRAHYYHVIASAFLTCRRRIAENNHSDFLLSKDLINKMGDLAHLNQVQVYKINGFKNNLESSRVILLQALDRLDKGKKPLLDPFKKLQKEKGVTEQEYKWLQAIVNRYEFELKLRLEQHRMGMELGHKLCANLKNYQDVDNGYCPICP